jgi:hypothetical protein
MRKFSKEIILKIESNLKLHSGYLGVPSSGKYLEEMDRLTYNYSGPRGLALSNMLNDYYKQVGVKNFNESIDRLKNQDTLL